MATIFENGGADAWAALHHAMLAGLQGGGELTGVVVQPLQTAERADWDTPNRFLNMYREYRIANQLPTWNPIYVPNTGVFVPDEFAAFLDELNAEIIQGSGSVDQARLKKLDKERQNAYKKLREFDDEVDKAWARYVARHNQRPPLGRSQWETEEGYAGQRGALRREVDMAVGAYLREVNQAGGELLEVGRVIGSFTDPNQKIPLPQDEDDALLSPESWQRWYRGGLSDDIIRFLSTSNSLEIVLEQSSTRTERFEERWSARANVGFFGVFGVGGGASNETIQRRAEADTSSVRVSFENIQSFAVDRGQWFKAGIIARFRDRMPAGFWGPRGRLNLIPAAVVLVRGVHISVTTSQEVTDYFFQKRSSGGSAGFRIGPWRIGGGGGRARTDENTSMTRTAAGFELKDESGRAQIVAVMSIRHADLLAGSSPLVAVSRQLTEDERREAERLLAQSRVAPNQSLAAYFQHT